MTMGDPGMLLIRCPTCGITIECGSSMIASPRLFEGRDLKRCANCGEDFYYSAADTFNDPTYRTRPWVHWMATYGDRVPIGGR